VCVCVCVCVHACTYNVYVQYSKVIPVSRMDGTGVPNRMIVATLVSVVFCLDC